MNWKTPIACVGIAWANLANGAAPAPAPAPTSLSDCVLNLVQSSIDVISTDVVLLRSDGTYQVISDTMWVSTKVTSRPPEEGNYQYSVDPNEPDHATVIFYPAGGATHQSDLYFTSATGGSQHVGFNSPFSVSPRQTGNGGSNVSNLAWLMPGRGAMTGFVIDSGTARWVLIRAVGPTLQQFGINPIVPAPAMTLFHGSVALGTYGSWSTDPNLIPGLKAAFGLTGAFPLGEGSSDCATVINLVPGPYTVAWSGGSDQGYALCEVYFLPY
jgi:hypothetical protein